MISVSVHFYSYFKELTGCAQTTASLADHSSIGDLLDDLGARFPRFAAMRKSMLIAVGLDYQTRDYQLKEGDEVSFFPPVQGG